MLFTLSLYVQNLLGFDALQAGLRFLPLSLLAFVGAPIAGRLSDKIGPKWILVAGMTFVCVGTLLMARLGGASQPAQWVVLLPGFIVAGIGSGMVNPPLSVIAMGTTDPMRAGMASGVANTCRQTGMAFGIALLGAFLSHRYNLLISTKVSTLNLHGLPSTVRQSIVTGLQKAGPIPASLGLHGDASQPNPYAHSPLFPSLQEAARSAFLGATQDVVWLGGAMLVIGVVATVVLVRHRDIRAH